MAACSRDEYWYYYIVASLVTFFGGLLFLIPGRICWYIAYGRKTPYSYEAWKNRRKHFGCFSRMRALAACILSGRSSCSKAVIFALWIVNLAAMVLYLVEATMFSVDDCGPVIGDPTQYAWLAFSAVFLLHYITRLMAASDKCYMWVDLYSIVDHLTIVPLLVGVYLDRNWLGLRCLRLLYLLQLPDFLQLAHIVKSTTSIRLSQIASIFLAIWLCSSGFVHITENNGDPHHSYENGQELTYWACVYWLLVTMSTVGYGEISPTTDITRAFIVIFIMGSFAMFTNIIPELASSLGKNNKYRKPFKRTHGKQHIVVCGNLTKTAVFNFIKNFLHEDSETEEIDIVFVDLTKPTLEMEAFFKRHFNDVRFVQGTVMNIKTLEDVKLRHASACLILSDRGSRDPDGEDAANIMRATAVKNYNPQLRVIIQLLQHRSKMNLLHIPNWHWKNGDDVICISELKNGILAQNCLAPGICTLLSNLFTMRTSKPTYSTDSIDLYKAGAGNEIYARNFSSSFHGMSFAQAASTCFRELEILLLAVHEANEPRYKRTLKVNPGESFIISAETVGFFIAQSPQQVNRVVDHVPDGEKDSKVSLTRRPKFNASTSKSELAPPIPEPLTNHEGSSGNLESSYLEYLETTEGRLAHCEGETVLTGPMDQRVSENAEQLDITGMVHWSLPRGIDDCVVDQKDARALNLENHVVVCLNADDISAEPGLVNFIGPLRASSMRVYELKDIVIIGSPDTISKEWNDLCNFPRIYILPPSRQIRRDLRAVNIQKCDMCVILTAGGQITVDETLLDKEAVLTTLTIKSMYGSDLEGRIKDVGVLTNPEAFRRDMAVAGDVPTVTELANDRNVAYVDAEDDDDPSVPLYLTSPYVSGSVFVSSVLDSLLSCTYLNGDVLTLIRALVTGGEVSEFEKILSEGLGIVRRNTLVDVSSARSRCRLGQLSLSFGPLEKLQHNNVYGDLFCQALSTYKVICLGLYRLMDPRSKDPRQRRRVVISNPPAGLNVFPSDRVFVLQPYDMAYSAPHPQRQESTKSSFKAVPDPDDVEYDNKVVFSLNNNSTVSFAT